MSKPLPPKRRFQVLLRDGFRCRYCGVTAAEARLHIDHVDPTGDNSNGNCVAACERCNQGKGKIQIPGEIQIQREPSHGGPRRGAGRPITTGSSATRCITYRVTAAQRAELEEEARRLGLSSADLAAKARAFPKLGTEVKR